MCEVDEVRSVSLASLLSKTGTAFEQFFQEKIVVSNHKKKGPRQEGRKNVGKG